MRALDAVVAHPNAVTNTNSQSRIDYFIVSKPLLEGDWSIHADYSCAFSPHAAVALDLDLTRADEGAFRLSQPRILPIDPPFGPLMPRRFEVDRENLADQTEQTLIADVEALSGTVAAWAAGAELELFDALGIPDDECVAYMGIGAPPR